MTIVGLTGSIASGKSTVSKMLRKRRVPVICADQLAREVVQPGETAYHKIVHTFGQSILQKNKRLHRKKLANLIFGNAALRAKLNAIVHPAVRAKLKSELQRLQKLGKKLVVLDIPLLFESGLDKLCDTTVVVYAPEAAMKKRLMARDKISPEDSDKRVASQLSIEKKKKLADHVVDNSGNLQKTRTQVTVLLAKLQTR